MIEFEDIKFLDLGMFDEEEEKLLKEDIEYRKKLNAIIKKSKENARNTTCYHCGKTVDGFCNSHSIPRFCLKRITVDGEVLTLNSLVNNPLIDSEVGVNRAGTFQLICRDCDNMIFSDYEDPINYENTPTSKMILQIAMKNYLKYISKREIELKMNQATIDVLGYENTYMQMKETENLMDLKEYKQGYNKAKVALEKNKSDAYYMCYYKKLDYVVPVAFQTSVALTFDLEGMLINDIYCESEEYEIKNIHVCVFPFEKTSCIMMFVDGNDKRYRKFYRQFNRLTLEDQLSVITFIMFAYSEEIYLSKTIKDVLIESKELLELARTGTDILATTPYFDRLKMLKEKMDFNKRKLIPNILSEKYKLF